MWGLQHLLSDRISSAGLTVEAVAGWKTWQQLGSKGFDFNISFDATAARKLSALLPEDEQTTLKVRISVTCSDFPACSPESALGLHVCGLQ